MAGVSLPDLLRVLPGKILAAQSRLDAHYLHGELSSLKRRAYRVLREHLGKVDLHRLGSGACFELKSDELELALRYSERTVSYAHSDLVAVGLIERPAPVLRGRRTPVWHTYLTPKARALLFGDQAQKVAPPLDKEQTLSGGQEAMPRADEEEHPTPEQPIATTTAEGKRFQVRKDLAPLLQVLVPAQIKKVLGVARRANVWVQHIMAHRLPAILRARDPEGYLVYLIHSGENWTRPVVPSAALAGGGGTAAAPAPEHARVEAPQADVPGFLAAHAGQWLAKIGGAVLVEVHAGGCVEHRRTYCEWLHGDVPPDALPRIVEAAQAGRLRFLEVVEAAAILAKRQFAHT